MSHKELISLRDVAMRWEHKNVLSGVSLDVNKGDFMAITGPNGGGKTTLLRIMLRLLKPTSGEVRYFPLNQAEELKIGYLPQKNMIDAKFPVTVRELVHSGLIKSAQRRAVQQQRVDETLREIMLTEHASKPIGELSGGQLQRALFGRAIISRPQLLVLDEPLSYLDKLFEEHMYHLLEQLREDTTIVLVSHEMSVISTMANRHIIVDHTLHECSAHRHYVPTDCC